MATFVAVPYQLYSLTGSALQVGLLSICDAVPLLAFAALGGTIADRFDRRRVVLWADIGLMAVVALLAVNAFAGSPQVWALYVLAFVATSFWSLGAPALRAMMPGLVRMTSSPPRRCSFRSTGRRPRSSARRSAAP